MTRGPVDAIFTESDFLSRSSSRCSSAMDKPKPAAPTRDHRGSVEFRAAQGHPRRLAGIPLTIQSTECAPATSIWLRNRQSGSRFPMPEGRHGESALNENNPQLIENPAPPTILLTANPMTPPMSRASCSWANTFKE